MTDLVSTQLELELKTLEQAKSRVSKDNEKANRRQAWSESKLGIVFHRQASGAFAEAVDAFLNQPATFGRRHNRAAEKLRQTGLEPAVIAHLFTKALYNLIPLTHRRRVKRVSLCIRAADLIHDEWRIRTFSQTKERKTLLKKLFQTFDKRTYPRDWRRRTIMNYFHAEQLDWSQWSTHDKLHVGYALLLLFRDSTGLIQTGPQSIFVDPVPTLVKAIEEAIEKRVLDFMIYMPMVVKPVAWTTTTLFRGGYLSTKSIRRYPIIKGSRKRDIPRLMGMDWSTVLPAVNALQETGWRVNKHVLDVLDWAIYERGAGFAGLPRADEERIPDEPPGYRTDEAIRDNHDRLCFLIHSRNREIISKRLMMLATVNVAKQFKNFKSIYFPHQLDSRGRAYPVPAFLNPQGPDYTKALLEFAEGKPIQTEEDAAWLAIAGANAFGKDKLALQDRVDWVQDNEEMIFSIAADPRSDLRWTSASEPFQFLRFCKEWKDFWDTGFGFVSHFVTPVDATCSGLQHYSALLRDEVGGRSVNLVPGLPRQDIYQDVADRVIEVLMKGEHKFDKEWITFGIDRKTTKRQVMVVPYAGTFSSCMEYTREAVNDKLKDGHPCPWGTEDPTERIVYLSKLIWDAIEDTVIKGKEAMRWLSKAASEYTKYINKANEGSAHDKRMSWITPDGFEAIHYRPNEKEGRVATYLDGRVRLTYREPTNKLEPRDMATAVAPNFIHSYDACLLRLSVVKAMSAGITTSFGMIHDSFGVHACDMSRFLKECVKPAFIEMYRENQLALFEARLPDLVKEKLDPIPASGSLDLDGVMESDFFFS